MNKKYLIVLLAVLSGLNMSGQTPSWLWANSGVGTSLSQGNAVTTDVSGNVYVTGSFKNPSITFGTTTLTNTSVGDDMFIVKYDVFGNVLWAKSAGGHYTDIAYSITADDNGNVLIAGFFDSDTLIFGTTHLPASGSGGLTDLFIVKYDALGNVLWAKSVGGMGYEIGFGISTDDSGNVLVAGSFDSDSITIGATTLYGASGSGRNTYVAKFDASGNALWAKAAVGTSATGSPWDYATAVTADPAGNVMITGFFATDSITFGSTTIYNSSIGNYDVFIVKYDASGNVLWARSAGGPGTKWGHSIAADDSGNVFVTGGYHNLSIQFGTTVLNNAGVDDIFVVKYDPLGNLLWAKSAGGLFSDIGYGISTDESGNAIVTGSYQLDSITFGTITLANAGGEDIFIAKYDPSGNVLSAKSAGGTNNDYGSGIAIDTSGNVLVTGTFLSDTLTFGTNSLFHSGNWDMFVAKFGIAPTIGITEESHDFNSVTVFPNPGNGQIKITGSSNIIEIKITNLTGQIIYHEKTNERNFSLQLDKPDIYFIQLTMDKQIVTKKIIVCK